MKPVPCENNFSSTKPTRKSEYAEEEAAGKDYISGGLAKPANVFSVL